MKFEENATVLTADQDEIGRLKRLVVNPRTNEVTDVVVRTGILSSKTDKVIPIRMIISAQDDEILLHPNAGSLQELLDYQEEYFVPVTGKNRKKLEYKPPIPVMIGYYPLSVPGQSPEPRYIKETKENIPENTVALEPGAPVITSDGEHVGDIETIYTDSKTDRVNHFVITQGLLLKERKLVPTSWVGRIEENKVHLLVDLELLNKLQEYRN